MEQLKESAPPADARPPEGPKFNIPWRPILCIGVPLAVLAYVAMGAVAFFIWMSVSGM